MYDALGVRVTLGHKCPRSGLLPPRASYYYILLLLLNKSDRRNANNYSPKVAQEKCIFSPKISIFSKTKIFLAKLRPSSRRHCPSPSSCQFSSQSFASSDNFWSINCEVVVAPCEATSVLLWTLRAQIYLIHSDSSQFQ